MRTLNKTNSFVSTEEGTGLDRSEVGTVNMFPLRKIKPSNEQARKQFDDEQLLELAQSIREHGLLQPMVIQSDGVLVAGERRLRACRLAGLIDAPVIVRDVEDSKESYLLGLIENLQRVDLNPMEEAHAYGVLRDDHGLTQEQIAAQVGKSRPAVANTMRLLKLPGTVQEMVQDGQLTAGHANELLVLGDKVSDIVRLANDCVNSEWSVLELRQNVDFVMNRTRQPVPAQPAAVVLKKAYIHPDEQLDTAFGAAIKQQPDNSEIKASDSVAHETKTVKPSPVVRYDNVAKSTQSGYSANGATDPYEDIDEDGEFDYSEEPEEEAPTEDTTELVFFDGQVTIKLGRLDVDLSKVLPKYTGYRVSITVDLLTAEGATSFDQIVVGEGATK